MKKIQFKFGTSLRGGEFSYCGTTIINLLPVVMVGSNNGSKAILFAWLCFGVSIEW